MTLISLRRRIEADNEKARERAAIACLLDGGRKFIWMGLHCGPGSFVFATAIDFASSLHMKFSHVRRRFPFYTTETEREAEKVD